MCFLVAFDVACIAEKANKQICVRAPSKVEQRGGGKIRFVMSFDLFDMIVFFVVVAVCVCVGGSLSMPSYFSFSFLTFSVSC